MPKRVSTKAGSELFIVDNSDDEWKVLRYLRDWCQLSKSIDVATGFFEIGSLLALDGEWQKVDAIRILMGDQVALRTAKAFQQALGGIAGRLDQSIESEKERNDFLNGVPAIVEAIRSRKILCRVYRKAKFHSKAYLTHARQEVVGSFGLVGSSNFTYPGLTENIELNVQITGGPVTVLQEWYEEHWEHAEDVTPEILNVVERHIREYSPFEVYAKALQEFFRGHEMTADEWELAGRENNGSRMFGVLDRYQQEGYRTLTKIAKVFGGAFLCDGVGLGKTFVGLMLIERLVVREGKNVALFVPKAANEPVWEPAIRQYLQHIGTAFSNLILLNHTDLQRGGKYDDLLADVKYRADAIVIDEAHHFRNPGAKADGVRPGQIRGEGRVRPSRYRRMFDLIEGPKGVKQVFLLTATPINNSLLDLQHMIELFSRNKADHFRDLGPVHHGRKVVQPSRDELRAFSRDAAPRLDFEPLWFDDAKRQALGESIGEVVRRVGYTVWACAVLKNHVHLCVRRHRDDANIIWDHFAEETRNKLRLFASIPDDHPVWSTRPYKVFLYTPDDVRRVIKYIEDNPEKEGLPAQLWDFITPYDGWPHPRPRPPTQ